MDNNSAGRRAPYWFSAKTDGIGWELPIAWQGWAVLLVYLACVLLTPLLLALDERPLALAGALALLTVLLLAVCWWKGEPILTDRRRRN